MKIDEVPQDEGLYEGRKSVCYALGENDRYVLAPSTGWEPLNIANGMAWEVISKQVEQALRDVHARVKSPLAYHMALNQMDIKLMAQYVRLPIWRVRRHLRWEVFERLKPSLKGRYAAVLRMPVERISFVPEIQRDKGER